MRTKLLLLLASAFIFNFQLSAQKALKSEKLKPYMNIWALVHMDVIYDFKQMDPDWIGGFRPSKIPVYPSDPGWGTNGHTYFSLRPSTFKFEGVMPTNHRWGDLKFRFEFDLFGMGANAGETTFRFRLAYGQFGPWLIGKQWSTFVDLDAFPDNYEWWGPSGMALVPTPMFRYTLNMNEKNRLEFAVELPGSDIDPGQLRQVDPALINVQSKEFLPDFITRYSFSGKWGYFRAAGMIRMLTYEVLSQEKEKVSQKSLPGWALNLTSTINLFTNGRLRLQTVFGEGYAGYNNDGGVEMAGDGNQNVVTPFQYGFAAFYDHYIGKPWTVSFGYSEAHQNNSAGQDSTAFNYSQYMVAQLIYEVIEGHFSLGINFQYGALHLKNTNSADDMRMLFSARYYLSKVHKKKKRTEHPKPMLLDRGNALSP